MSVRYEDNTANAKREIELRRDITLQLMINDIHRKSTPITPLGPPPDNFGLRTSVHKWLEHPGKAIIEWRVPYAQYQERGMREDKSRVVRHYTTPGTHAHFASQSVQAVLNDIAKYLYQGGLI